MIRRNDTLFGDRPEDWLMRAVTAGFLATILVTAVAVLSYLTMAAIGRQEPEAPYFLRWSWALAYNPITQSVRTNLPLAVLLHFIAGLGWAIAYAVLVEPRLSGPGWRNGAIFSLVPWLLSLVALMPIVGGGILGVNLGAGPLPILGNLVLHLIYGMTLGQMYLEVSDRPLEQRGSVVNHLESATLTHAGRAMAMGIVVGLVLGAIVGVLIEVLFASGLGVLTLLLLGAIGGSVIGAVIGSFWGLSPEPR